MITPRDFVDRWAHSQLREQQAAQSHFNELCQLVGYKTPTELDPEGTFFTFEEQVTKATGGKGRADVWYKGKFAWEYKGKHRDLDAAYAQLLAYKGDLDNPPLLVVCDFLEYRIYPQWPNTSGLPFVFKNEDLLLPEYQRFILWLLESPEQFLELRRSELEQREQITLDLALKFAHLADLMRQHAAGGGYQWQPLQIARFLTKVVFALFAEDIGLLPVIANSQPALRFIIEGAKRAPHEFVPMLRSLFEAMDGAHYFLMYYVPYFNGGVFRESQPGSNDGHEVLEITFIPGAINLLEELSEKDWRYVNPTIFGTLFEGALDVSKRAQLGAHYTGEADIQLVVEPVLMQPLYRQWQVIEAEAQPLMQVYLNPELPPRPVHEAGVKLQALYQQMMTTLSQTRVLDPACGSGNFLYMSLRALKDLEGRVRRVFEPLQLPYADAVTPRQLYGIEKDEFAANLAKVVVWIGYLQWRYEDEGGVLHYANPRKSGEHPRQLPNPILKDKNSPDEPDRIVCDDSIMRYRRTSPPNPLSVYREGESGEEAQWAERERRWLTPTELWDMLKPLARQMRHEATPAEDALWGLLLNRQFEGLKFRRQHTIDRFIADFYCAEANLIVEVDGDIHQYTQEEDALRTAFLESQGLRVVRVQNEDVLHKPDSVLTMLRKALRTSPPSPLSASREGELRLASDSPSLYTERGAGGEVALEPYEPEWPEVDVIIGNPPFLGGNKIRAELGNYVDDLFKIYDERVPAFADLVCYWYEKARTQIENGKAKRAGLLATNSIRGGVNRAVLDHIKQTGDIFMAWGDRPWILQGAAVRISIVAFDDGSHKEYVLDGAPVDRINSDLQNTIDATKARKLSENGEVCFMGPSPKAPFDISEDVALKMLKGTNKSGHSNSDVVRPVISAVDIVQRSRGEWTIDFGLLSVEQAAEYELPFKYAKQHVYPVRSKNRRSAYAEKWWQYAEARPGLRHAIANRLRFIVTPALAKHRIIDWGDPRILYNQGVLIFARDDDYFFGALHSYLHEIWALRLGTSLEDRPRYTPTTTFETFPFPWSPGKEDVTSPHHIAISTAAQQLHEEREVWLNPPDLIALGADSKALKERTLTNLYNALVAFRTSPPGPLSVYREGEKNGNGNGKRERIAKSARDFAPRLAQLHDALDAAVLAAYGWDDVHGKLRTAEGDEELLRRLLALNLARAGGN